MDIFLESSHSFCDRNAVDACAESKNINRGGGEKQTGSVHTMATRMDAYRGQNSGVRLRVQLLIRVPLVWTEGAVIKSGDVIANRRRAGASKQVPDVR